MGEANEKGAALERAAKAIEEMVLRSHPGLGQAPFSIQPNAIVTRNGVRHELDLLVRINEGSPYETLHLFECKNWREPVDKNAVIILAEKVHALGAARGTLIASAFTRDAEAQARTNNKIELVSFDEDIWHPLSLMRFEGTSHHFTRFKANVIRRAGSPETPEPEWAEVPCRFGSRVLPFFELAYELANQWLRETEVFRQDAGTHTGSGSPAWAFDPGELTAGTWEVETVALDFDYSISLRPARLVSTCSIEKRGRFARFECEPDPFDGTQLAVEVLGKPGPVA